MRIGIVGLTLLFIFEILFLGPPASAAKPTIYEPIGQESFSPIQIIPDYPKPSFYLVDVPQVVSKPGVESKTTPKPKATPKPTVKISGHSVAGVASWYCKSGTSICTRGYPGGLYAAIRRDLLFLRGRTISVCRKSCIRVRVIDCNCGPHANLIDLYSDAFRKLAPLSSGRITVVIKW